MSSQPQDETTSTPDHVENTGENLRRAAEVTHEANDDSAAQPSPDDVPPANPLPDFNT
jgi:hypothetical protein